MFHIRCRNLGEGTRGSYRVNLWHGVSRVRSGSRYQLELFSMMQSEGVEYQRVCLTTRTTSKRSGCPPGGQEGEMRELSTI